MFNFLSGLHEFDSLKNSEVNYFRSKMKTTVDEVARSRQNKSWLERLYYQYPPRISMTDISDTVKSRLRDGNFKLTVKNTAFENTEVSFVYTYFFCVKSFVLSEE